MASQLRALADMAAMMVSPQWSGFRSSRFWAVFRVQGVASGLPHCSSANSLDLRFVTGGKVTGPQAFGLDCGLKALCNA